MSKLITGSEGMVQQPFDKYWDGPVSRREVQLAVNDLANNERHLSMQNDTNSIVLNFLCEKLSVTRAELDSYVERKKAEALALQNSQEASVEQPVG